MLQANENTYVCLIYKVCVWGGGVRAGMNSLFLLLALDHKQANSKTSYV